MFNNFNCTNKEFEKFITLESYFKDVFFYEDKQSICSGYPLEEFYPEMIKLYSKNNKYFPLILLNERNEILLVDRDNDLVETASSYDYAEDYSYL